MTATAPSPGYVRKRTVYKLTFTDPEYEGLRVLVRSMNMGEFRAFVDDMEELEEQDADLNDLAALAALEPIYSTFVGYLMDWNLQQHTDPFDETTPVVDVPRTVEGLLGQEPQFVMTMINAWMESQTAVDAPLGQRSSDGRPSEELASMMEPLSASQAS